MLLLFDYVGLVGYMVAEKESSSGCRDEEAYAVSPTVSTAICLDLAEQLQIEPLVYLRYPGRSRR